MMTHTYNFVPKKKKNSFVELISVQTKKTYFYIFIDFDLYFKKIISFVKG